jgi:predicted lipid-binding transport protein (Tim44 family)
MTALVLSGCATLNQQRAESAIAERAQARWDALIEGDFKKAYQYETPGYRAVFSERAFESRFGKNVRWQEAKVRAVTLDGDTAEVRVLVEYQSVTSTGQVVDGVRPLWERWQLVDGEWWFSNR